MMAMDRREFLKIAGLSALAGLAGGRTAFELLAPGEVEAQPQGAVLTAGKKWGLVVDMTKMTDPIMDKCIEACHRTHNVPNHGNPKEEIKWIWKETFEHSFPGQEHEYLADKFKGRNFLLLCNHCTNPPCCRACPTKATWKRADGVVMMDMHRCIGCRFCMAACPFGARSFNWGDPRRAPKALNPEFPDKPGLPHPLQRGGGEVRSVRRAACQGRVSRLRGGGQQDRQGQPGVRRPGCPGLRREKIAPGAFHASAETRTGHGAQHLLHRMRWLCWTRH